MKVRFRKNNLCSEIFQDCGEVNRGSGTYTFGILAGLEESGDTANRKLEPRFAASRLGFLCRPRSECLSPTRHFELAKLQ